MTEAREVPAVTLRLTKLLAELTARTGTPVA